MDSNHGNACGTRARHAPYARRGATQAGGAIRENIKNMILRAERDRAGASSASARRSKIHAGGATKKPAGNTTLAELGAAAAHSAAGTGTATRNLVTQPPAARAAEPRRLGTSGTANGLPGVGGIRLGAHTLTGKQHDVSEDTFHVALRGDGGGGLPDGISALAAVFDGHGGAHCSRFLERAVAQAFAGAFAEQGGGTPAGAAAAAAARAMRSLEHGYIQVAGDMMRNDGSCGVVAVVTLTPKPHLVVAHVGDCRALLFFRGDQASTGHGHGLGHGLGCAVYSGSDLTADHRVTQPSELERVLQAGADVEAGYCYAAKGQRQGLAVTRCFGDRLLKAAGGPQVFIAEPTVAVVPLGCMGGERVKDSRRPLPAPPEQVLVLCSDGMTDALTCRDVAAVLGASDHTATGARICPPDAARRLARAAVAKGSTDDVTVVVVAVPSSGCTATPF